MYGSRGGTAASHSREERGASVTLPGTLMFIAGTVALNDVFNVEP